MTADSIKTIAVLVTLDTKGDEARFLRGEIEALGGRALLIDVGVIDAPAIPADVTREQVAAAGGSTLAKLLESPSRQEASPVMNAGATKLLLERIATGEVHAVLGLGGTQGTSNHTQVMQQLPYGFPKVMVSTVASGDTSAFVGIKDITMMFSVGDILGLNPVTRKILANAAGAAWGMASTRVELDMHGGAEGKPTIGMTNLGVLTHGAMHALELFKQRGYEVIVFHAVGSGGRAMEQMMKEGLIGAVFDYGLGEIPDEIFDGLRAGGKERLSVAGSLGLPQVLVPGGLEHIGLMVEPNTVPERWKDHLLTFHNPIIVAPRLNAEEMCQVAREIGARLATGGGSGVMLMPMRGTSSYGVEGGPLRDPEGDIAFSKELRASLPASYEFIEVDAGAEDPAFVERAVDALIAEIEARSEQ